MLRWGLLGTSFISGTMADAIAKSQGSTVVAVAGRDLSRLQDFASRYSIPKSYSDYEGLCRDPDIDVVYVGLPNHIHHAYSLLAASQGKHVLCEKSLSIDMEKTESLLNGLANSSVFFVEGLMYRAHPVISAFVDLIRNGRLGDLRVISAYYHADIAQFVNPMGKGALYNLGCYPASLMQLVMSASFGDEAFENRQLSGYGIVSSHEGNITDAIVNARFNNGVLAQIATSETHGMAFGFTVTGQSASARFFTNPWLPDGGDNIIEIIDHSSGSVAERIAINSGMDAFDHQVHMIEEAIAEGRREAFFPSPSHNDSRAIMRFLTDWEAACKQH